MNRPLLPGLLALLLLPACPKPEVQPEPAPDPWPRCEVDLDASGLFALTGTGAVARVIASEAELIGGARANGRNGDVLLQNDRIRVVVEQPGRSVGPILSGGGIIDADVVRPPGTPGRDTFGRMGLIYALGRITSVKKVEVLRDGSEGGPAVVAATGRDVRHDLLDLKALLRTQADLSLQFVVDPHKPLALRTTTYWVLSPGEARVRALTAFCNDGDSNVVMPLVELMDVGTEELFFPGACSNSLGASKLGSGDCIVQTSPWVAAQGDGVAYGLRPASLADPGKPGEAHASIGYGGVVGAFVEGESLNGVISWADPEARNRPGAFTLRGRTHRTYLRDFFVAADIAGLSSEVLAIDGVATGTVEVTTPAGPARVSVSDLAGKMKTLIETDGAGRGSVRLQPGEYRLSAAAPGHLLGPELQVTVTAGETTPVALALESPRVLSVQVRDVGGAPGPAKVTVHCAGGPCPFSPSDWARHMLIDAPRGGAAAVGYVPVSGWLDLPLPAGQYEVVVTRGPEFSVWPDTWPQSAFAVDLRDGGQSVSATLGRVVDTAGWMSADLHVHANNSSDSTVVNEKRVASFLAEGVDVLLSTDHEWITDFAPTIASMGAQGFIGSMIGAEVTSFSHGHFNAFPLKHDPSLPNGGAFDHAGGEDGPTPRMTQLFAGIKAAHEGAVVQLNHPRGGGGVLTQLRVDTATLATHADPAGFDMEAAPDALSTDTRLLGDGFDIIETANGPSPSYTVLNDWMTMLSRGTVRTASGVSDSHSAESDTGGYARTYARIGVDAPAAFQPAMFAEAMRTQRALVSNGPFVRFSARRLDAGGQPTGAPVEIGGTLSVSAGEVVELTVEVQAPEWMRFDRVELYTHVQGREALDGAGNGTWPASRIFASRALDAAALAIEPVAGPGDLRRVSVVERFTVQPARDTWFVAMVRGLSTPSLWPLHGDRAVAYTNAILIDADGSGSYDDFPLQAGQPLTAPRPREVLQPRVPTAAELQAAILKLLRHEHE